MNLLGPILTADHVEQAALDTLKAWMPTYLAEMERQTGRPAGSVPMVRSWSTLNQFAHWTEDQLPGVILVSPGLAQHPTRRGDGSNWARWTLGVGIVVSARDQPTTNALAKLYAAAVRACLLQHPSLGGKSEGLGWTDERYTDVPSDQARSVAGAQLIFWVEYKDVVNDQMGPPFPAQPSPTPLTDPGDGPVVRTHTTSVTPR